MHQSEADAVATRARNHVSAKLDEADSLVKSFRAASLRCVQTTSGRMGASVHDVSTRRTEVREVAFEAGAVLSLADSFPRFGLGIGLGGDTRLLGVRLSSSNIGYINGYNGMVTRLEPGSRWCNVTLDRDFIHSVAEVHGYSIPAGDAAWGMPIPAHNALGLLLVRAARNDLWAELCDAELEDELALTVLRVFKSRSNSARKWGDRRWHAVNKVIEYLQTEFTTAITVTGLCKLAGVSERTLQYAFREHTGLSVQQYLTACRLQAARALILHGECDRVSDAARACGIYHPGRFAQYYRRMYGETPHQSMAANGTIK